LIFLISGSWMLRTMIEFIEHLFSLMTGL
jgi:flagellar biosynthesis protein FliQ